MHVIMRMLSLGMRPTNSHLVSVVIVNVDGGTGDMYTRGRAEGEQASRVSKAGLNTGGGSGVMYTRGHSRR